MNADILRTPFLFCFYFRVLFCTSEQIENNYHGIDGSKKKPPFKSTKKIPKPLIRNRYSFRSMVSVTLLFRQKPRAIGVVDRHRQKSSRRGRGYTGKDEISGKIENGKRSLE